MMRFRYRATVPDLIGCQVSLLQSINSMKLELLKNTLLVVSMAIVASSIVLTSHAVPGNLL